MNITIVKFILLNVFLILFSWNGLYARDECFIDTRTTMGFTYKIDYTDATIKLDVVKELSPEENEICNKLYPNYITAISAAKRLKIPILPSVQLIWGKTKQFNDGLYASLETELQRGISLLHQGKINFLKKLLQKVLNYQKSTSGFARESADIAVSYVICGLVVSGEKVEIPTELEGKVNNMKNTFLKDESKSKPIGFFTWSDVLKKIFLQDRFYQKLLGQDIKENLAAALLSHIIITDLELSKQYNMILEFYRKMTNPFSALSCKDYGLIVKRYGGIKKILSSKEEAERFSLFLENNGIRGMALFPFSYSKETELMKKEGRYIPMISLIKLIQKGKINLAPTKESGWYDYQQYALETLILPEKAEETKKLILTEEYKEYLKQAFGAMLTKARETHVKQLEIAEGIEITISPKLTLEPLSTVYLRIARGYKFLSENLQTILGTKTLNDVHRMQEDESNIPISVSKELKEIMLLMYGLYLLSCQDLGLKPNIEELKDEEIKQARSLATTWIKNLEHDKDLQKDIRVSVPVFLNRDHNENLSETVNWAILGVKFFKIEVTYENKPKIISAEGISPLDFVYEPQYYLIPVDVSMEFVRTKKPFVFTRIEFRELCDQYKTEEEIKDVLGKDSTMHKNLTIFILFIGIFLLCGIVIGIWLIRVRKR